jgi:hypothetical protein
VNDRASRGHGAVMMSNARSLVATLVLALGGLGSVAHADDPAPAPAPAPAPPFHAIVSGGPAGGAERVARAIEAELGRTVELLASDAACPAPCAAVVIDASHNTATVRLTSDAGELRQRTISVPTDPAGIADIIALLVGNMAREEATTIIETIVADDVVEDAGDPAPEPAPTPEPTPEPVGEAEPPPAVDPASDPALDALETPPPIDTTPVVEGSLEVSAEPEQEGRTSLSIGLVPPIGLRFGGAYRRGLSIYALVGLSRESHVLSLSGAVDVVSGDVFGAQIAGAVATAGRVRGIQIAGAVGYAGRVDGVQIAGAVSASDGGAGVQIAGAVDWADGRAGTQIAGAVSAAKAGAGVQIAGAVTYAGGSVGTQIAGAVNVAEGHVYGAQIGTINVAGEVDGVQIGVVNVARKSNGGLSLGLINVVPGGRSELEATVDTDSMGAVMFRHGGKRWHNVYGVAGRATPDAVDDQLTDDDVFMYGFGFGPTFTAGPLVIDVDAIAWHVLYGDGTHGHADLLAQARIVGAYPIGGVKLVGGVAWNTYITTDPLRDGFTGKRVEPSGGMDTDTRVTFTPSAFIGVRL